MSQRPLPIQQRARRALCWCAVALGVSPFLGGFLVDHCPLHIRNPEPAVTLLRWQMNEPSPDVLLLGSSRMGSFVRTEDVADATRLLAGNNSMRIFNAAFPCGEPMAIEFFTRRLLAEKKVPPRLAVVEISPDLLARNNAYIKFVITGQLKASDLPGCITDILLSDGGISRLASSRLTPFFLHRTHLTRWALEMAGKTSAQQPPPDNAGQPAIEGVAWQSIRNNFQKRTAPLPDRIQTGARRFQSRLRRYQLAGRTSEAFEETVAMLHDQGCVIVLVHPPLSSAQRALFTADIRTQFSSFVQRLETAYGCLFVDFSDRLPDALFVDNHHGGDAGSKEFSQILAREAMAPAWARLSTVRGGK